MVIIMSRQHHILDVWPEPKETMPRFINEAWLVDDTVNVIPDKRTPPEKESDNIRIYVPLDLNKKAILRRLDAVIEKYGYTSEENEMAYSLDVERLVFQIEIYDQYCYIKELPKDKKHSTKAIELVKAFVDRLDRISVTDSEYFPYRMIRELNAEYLGIEE